MNGLIIGFDAKRAVMNYTGLGNYSRLAIDVVSRAWPDNDYRLYTPRIAANDRLAELASRPGISIVPPDTAFGRRFGAVWRSSGLSRQLRREGVDLYHGLSNELPWGIDVPAVVTIHDVIFRRHPEFYTRTDAMICDRKFGYAARKARQIVAISECTRRDIVEFYGVDPKKITLVYQGCHESFYHPVAPEDIAGVRRRYSLPERYIAAVGTVEARKNQALAVKALRALPDDVGLVIAGRRTAYAREVERTAAKSGVAGRVTFVEGIPFAELPALYAGAQFASYTSRYEGFGIPVIEAIAAGVPVVAATGSCLEEAGGPGAFYVGPDDVDGYADVARRLLADESLRQATVKAGRAHIVRFSAENFAEGLLSAYTKTLQQQ